MNPPKSILRFLQWFCPPSLYESIEGDLLEQFERDLEERGERKAKRKLFWNVMKFFRPGIILRNKFSFQLNHMDMLRSCFRMAWRHLLKDKTVSCISIVGLSLSIAVCLFILQYAVFEMRYDQFGDDSRVTYRVTSHAYKDNVLAYESALSSPKILAALKEQLPEVDIAGRLFPTRSWFNCTLTYAGENQVSMFNESHLYYADQSVLSLLPFRMKQGDAAHPLENPYSAVISESVAHKYFGQTNPIGKVLHLKGSNDDHDYTVTGVFEDLPRDSHLDATILLSASSLADNPNSGKFDSFTYVQLSDKTNIEQLKDKLKNFISANLPSLNTGKLSIQLGMQPVQDIHLYSSLEDEITPPGNLRTIYFLMLIALVILGIAWINYINLATSRALSRAKEVGIRKVSGANRLQLISQLLSESVIINAASVFLALALMYFLTPSFQRFTGLTVSFSRFFDFLLTGNGLLIVAIFCGGIFLSGFYPARFIASYNPVRALKGVTGERGGSVQLRKVLVVFQFTCAVILTVSVLTFHEQFRFMFRQELGIDIAKTLILKAPNAFDVSIDSTYLTRLASFKTKLQEQSLVTSITSSSALPGDDIGWQGVVRKEGDDTDSSLDFGWNIVDQDFIASYKLRLIAGRNFDVSDYPEGRFGKKTESVIVNREGARQLGFTDPSGIIGTNIYWGTIRCVVVGVIDDYHQQSLKRALQPSMLTAYQGPNLSLKLGPAVNSENLSESVSMMKHVWNTYFPDHVFDYSFLDDHFEKQYTEDRKISNLFTIFCGIAILISCLGLFGLASFTIRKRNKEISIRKVLGAATGSLLGLLTKEFVILIIAASCLAVPLAYLGMREWLNEFAFHIDLNVWMFVMPIAAILFISLLTISLQTLKTVFVNPVETLKDE